MEDSINHLFFKLSSLISQEINLVLGVKDEVQSLVDELNIIQSYLQSTGSNSIIRDYVGEIISLVYRTEDVVDLYAARTLQVQNYPFYVNKYLIQFYERYKASSELKFIQSRLKDIVGPNNRNQSMGLLKRLEDEYVLFPVGRMDPFEENYSVGFGEEKERIVNKLFGESPGLEVISIVGMSGLGKTTLATKIYNDTEVVAHFHTRLWVGVSTTYNPRSVLNAISRCILNISDGFVNKNEDDLVFEIRKYFRSTRYLVVFDDVWDIRLWNDLEKLFGDNLYGSRILITTRNVDAIDDVPNNSKVHLRLLTDTECWKILSTRIFNNRMTENHIQFEKLGIEIAKNCKGLPLSISVIGGLLNRKVTTEWWDHVSSCVSTYTNGPKEQCSEILELSYKDLPIHLKQCFLFLGLFPEDKVIRARHLIQFWVAEQFIQNKETRTLEEVAKEYLDELIARNLVQIVKRKSDGTVKSCSIHDLLRDFCLTKAKGVEYLGYEDSSALCGSRRLALHSKTLAYLKMINSSSSHLRSLLIFGATGKRIEEKHFKFLCNSYILLTILDFGGVLVDSFSSLISQLVCLRFLRLKSDSATELPKSICKLFLLETLEIVAPRIENLEINVWKMPRLRHVYFNGSVILKKPPKMMSQDQPMPSLQTLSSINPESCTSDLLPKLHNLVNLGIFGDVAKLDDETFMVLSRLERLEKLKVIRDLDYKSLRRLPSMEGLVYLKKLTLCGIGLIEDPMKQLMKLPCLQILKLKFNAYVGDKLVCVEKEGFPGLEVLQLISLNIKDWNVSARCMPSLIRVVVNSCPRLIDFPSSLKDISTFQELSLLRPTPSVAKKAQEIKAFKESKKERFKLGVTGQGYMHH